MRIETKIALLFNAVSVIINRFTFFPDFLAGFLTGLFLSLGIFLFIIGLIPKKLYDKLLYRRLLANKKG